MPGGLGKAGRYYAVAFDFIGAIMAGVFGGWFLDNKFGMAPYGTPLLVVLGVIAGFARMVRALRRFEVIDRERGD
jgi:F0F1-type ATP synthase assembly protein I